MLRSNVRFVLCAAFLTLIAGCSGAHSDQAITTDIQSRMFSNAQTKSANIAVTVDHGRVTIAGQVPDEATRDEAVKLAQDAPGVKTVSDRMSVQQAALQPSVASPPASVAAPAPSPDPPARAKAAKPAVAARRDSESALNDPELAQEFSKLSPSQPAPQAVAPPPAKAPTVAPAPQPVAAPPPAPAPPPPPQPRQVEIPSGTSVRVQLIDPVDTSRNRPGDVFHATLAAPIVVGTEAIVPAGTDIFVTLVDSTSAGRIKGKSTIQLQLARLEYQGTSYALLSDDYNQEGKNRTTRSVETIGGGAAIGAIIGAIAGGGKGAAIGAGVGGGAGTAAQAATHGEQIRLPAETKLDFTLQQPVTVHYFPDKNQRR